MHRLTFSPWVAAGLVFSLSAAALAGSGASNTTSSNAISVSPATAQTSALAEIKREQTAYASVRQALFGLNANGSANANSLTGLTWDPTHDSSYWTVLDSSRNQPILSSNWSYTDGASASAVVLGVTGIHPSTLGRYAAFGGNPLGERGNADMDSFMQNTIAWLTQRSDFSNFKVVVAHLPGTETYWFPHEAKVRSWLASRYPQATINGKAASATQADNLCDGDALDACLQGANLLVIGREQDPKAYNGETVMAAVLAAQKRGIPVLYLHHYRDVNDLAGRLLDYFALAQSNNYWSTNGLKAWAPAKQPAKLADLSAIQALLEHLAQGNFNTTWSGCTSSGRINCDADSAYVNEFATPADLIRERLQTLDGKGVALFSQAGYKLEKQLVLLGDEYRQAVSYPMEKKANAQAFLRAYFADKSVYLNRPSTVLAQNLGNFAAAIPASTPALSKTLKVAPPTTGTKDYMTGLYVMPGRKIVLTRTDAGTGTLSFGVNMLRDTTWLFNTYDRPTDIRSPRIPLKANQPVTITSPYGGPLFLFVDAAAGAPSVAVKVQGVTTHPVLRDATNAAQVAAFTAEVASTPTSWVGFTSDMLTLHSTLDHFKTTMAAYSGDMAQLASDTWLYTIKDTYELAGFNAASGKLSLPATVSAFCSDHAWDCTGLQHRRDVMQHVVSDVHAACGDGCSGNPFDEDWAFEPLGWGETHEIGHNLQVDRLKIYSGRSTEVSNNIFPMHKQMVFNQTARGVASPIVARAGTGKVVFDDIKAALASASPSTAMYNKVWASGAYAANNSERVMFYRQLAEFTRYYNPRFADGWEVYTLMYLLDRNFEASSSNWAAVASGLGFGSYSSYPKSMNGNDFMLIASSFIIGRDMRAVFDLWGVTYSSAASAQVAAYGYAAAQALLFPMSHLAQVPAKVGAPIVMSTSAVYPAGY